MRNSEILEPKCHGTRKLTLWQMFSVFCILFEERGAVDFGIGSGNSQKHKITLTAAGMDYKDPEFVAPQGFARVHRKSRGSPLSLNVYFPIVRDLPRSVNISYTAYQKFNNQWKESFLKGFMGFCDSIESKIKLYRILYEYSNFPQKCPITKGNYTIDDFNFEDEELPVLLPLNEWRIKLVWLIGDKNILQWWMVYKLEQGRGSRPNKNNHHG